MINFGGVRLNEIQTNIDSRNLLLNCIYKSPSLNKAEFTKHFETYLAKADFHILAGDVSINILNGQDSITHNYLNALSAAGLKSLINEVTRSIHNQNSRIDHIFVKTDQTKFTNIPHIITQTPITDH